MGCITAFSELVGTNAVVDGIVIKRDCRAIRCEEAG
jgi:hypothetical protein